MERLKNLGTRLSKYGRLVSWALYLCPFCLQEVEKPVGNGERCKSCGCKTKEIISKFMEGRFVGEKNPMYGKSGELNPFYGKKHTEEANQKNKESHLGKKRTEKQRMEQSKRSKGELNPFYGKNHTEESINKQSEIKKGKYAGENNPMYGERFFGENNPNYGNGDKIKGKNNPMYGKSGELSPNWNNGSSFLPYPPEFNKELKQFILERDEYQCQDPNCDGNHKKLHVHHIDYDKKNNNPENLITLCNSCHSKTNGKKNRQYYTEFYQNIMIGKVVECFS